MRLLEFCVSAKVQLIVYPSIDNQYCVSFNNCKFKDSYNNPTMVSCIGRGVTITAAISDFIMKSKRRVLVKPLPRSNGVERRIEYIVPELEI